MTEQAQQMVQEPSIEVFGIAINATDFWTAVVIAVVTGAIATGWYFVRKRLIGKTQE